MKIGVLFSVFDGDVKHFNRFTAELTRLDLPFAVNFDHCCQKTIDTFRKLPNYLHGYVNNNPESFFDESHRQHALDILLKDKFDWAVSLDVDETLELRAPTIIRQLAEARFTDLLTPERGNQLADVIGFQVLDLWGDDRHYRTDGPFHKSHREKMFHIGIGHWEYYHPTIHAPKLTEVGGRAALYVRQYPCRVLHWGIMDESDIKEHTERWDAIYTRKVGNNPYGFYPYINNVENVPVVVKVPEDVYA